MTLPVEIDVRERTVTPAAPRRTIVDVTLRPTTGLIATLREFVLDLTSQVTGDREMSSRIAVAVHELLENCVKYSTDGMASLRVEVGERDGRPLASLRVTNRASAAQIETLRAALAELGEATNAAAFYEILMRRSVARSTGSGLGLARIWAEGDMTLRGEIEGELVTLVAEARSGG